MDFELSHFKSIDLKSKSKSKYPNTTLRKILRQQLGEDARNRHKAPKNRFATVSHHEMTKPGKTKIERENLLDLMQPNKQVEGNKATTSKTLKSQEIFSRRTSKI